MYCCWLQFQIISFNIKIRRNCELSKGKKYDCTQIYFSWLHIFLMQIQKLVAISSLKMSTMAVLIYLQWLFLMP